MVGGGLGNKNQREKKGEKERNEGKKRKTIDSSWKHISLRHLFISIEAILSESFNHYAGSIK